MKISNSGNAPCRKAFLRILSALLSAFLMIGALPPTVYADNTVYTIAELQGKYKTQGRTAIVDNALRLDWSASGMIFKADCSGEVKITVEPTRINTSSEYGDYFTVYVDGVMQYEDKRIPEDNSTANWTSNFTGYPFHITKTGDTEYTIASNLPQGEHTFEIYHQNEAANARFGIKSVTLNGTFLEPPKDNELYIEIVGDSIAASFGNISVEDNRAPLYQDSTRGWPFLTTRALNADWSVIARTGITATKGIGFSGSESVSMQEVYPYLRYYSDTATEYDFARQPDVILVSLGTNDMATYSDTEGATTDTVKQGFLDMLTLLREKNPNAKIVWLYGMMTSSANSLINEALTEAGGINKGYYGFELPAEPTGKHPKLTTQYEYADLLAEYLTDVVLNSDYKEANGFEKGDVTVYRATDAADNASGAYYSDDDTVWKFGVSGFDEIFKTADDSFSAPKAEPLEGGALRLSWTAPEKATGKTTVKILSDNYNKEIFVADNTVTLNDTKLGNTYQVQVTIGGISSKVLTYSHIYAPTFVTDAKYNVKTQISSNTKNKYDNMYINLNSYTDLITENSGVLVKIGSNITSENNVVSYYDNHTNVKAQISCDSEGAEMEKMSMATGDVSLVFNTLLKLPISGKSGYSAGSTAVANTEAKRSVTYFDINGGGMATSSDTNNITAVATMKSQDFTEGYIFIPFDLIDEASMATVKENGAVNLTVQYHRYYAKNYYDNDSVWKWHVLNWSETDYGDTSTDDISYWFDREVHFEEVKFIADYDAFFSACVDTENLTSGVVYGKLSASSGDKSAVYMTATANSSDYTLTSDIAKSNYLVDTSPKTNSAYPTNLVYTTAAGEKMKLGFTAPKSGLYEISAPITANAANGIHYRVTKENKYGAVSILQDEKIYNGEKYFTLMTAFLNRGDTVYLEAWANSPATAISLGVPQFILLGSDSTEASVVYKANEHIGINNMNDFGSISVWEFGTFVNPFIADGEEYNYLHKTAYEAATEFDYDVLGITELSATDNTATTNNETDGSKLYNAFKPYDAVATYSAENNKMLYQSKENGLGYKSNAYNNQTPYRYAWSGQLSADKRKYNTDVTIRYGMSTAAGGGQKNVYINFGHYQQFNAPQDGSVTLDLGTALNSGKVIVLHNTKVIATYIGGALAGAEGAITLNVAKGDTISIAHAAIEDTENNLVITDTGEVSINPVVTFTPDKTDDSIVSFDSEIPVIMNSRLQNGTVITLPTTSKAGAIFLGWTDDGSLWQSGEEYTVENDVDFKANFIYYGDLNGSGEGVESGDLSILRKVLTNTVKIEDTVNGSITADIDTNGVIDLIDLVRMKKMSAEIDVSVGIK